MALDRTNGREAWHARDADAAVTALGSDAHLGLSSEDAARRLIGAGPNQVMDVRRRSPIALLIGQFTDVMILILIAAAIISGALGDIVDTFAILAIVLLNAAIGFTQDFRAEKAVRALRSMASPRARVVRDGLIREIAARDVVPGDIAVLEAGDAIPADLRLIESANLSVEEAALTGESVPVEKSSKSTAARDAMLGDRVNTVFKGTTVVRGRGRGIVVATGMATEIGRIAGLLVQAVETRTPMQVKLARFGRVLAIAIIVICAVILVLGLARGEPPLNMFLTAVSLAVAAIPEALPAVVTVGLALGAQRMARVNALVRNLPAVETLGAVTVICTDKTGTLTRNRMSVESVYGDGAWIATADPMTERLPAALWIALAISNDVRSPDQASDTAIGDPTELALYEAAAGAGFVRADTASRFPRVAEIPFESERKAMSTLHQAPSDTAGTGKIVRTFVKGAPEAIVARCTKRHVPDGTPFDPGRILDAAEAKAAEGYRVLAFALRDFDHVPADLAPDEIERDLEFLGLVALLDGARPEAAEAVATCRAAGIRPIMVTGDHAATAVNIAVQTGIAAPGDAAMTGTDIAALSDHELAAALLRRSTVFARVAPEHKIRIVKALQDAKQFVAMTGDGVNDAPALKQADIGVSMGKVGTDVARESSDLILLNDNFATIVAAVREGRRMYDNVRRFVKFALAGNSAEILTLSLAPFFGLPLPFLPIHILWINFITDGLPGLALASEPAGRDVMARPPRPRDESILGMGLWQQAARAGALMTVLSLGVLAWSISQDNPHWQTLTFTTLTFCQLAFVASIRTDDRFTIGLRMPANRAMTLALAVTVGLQMAAIYVPIMNDVLKTTPLPPFEFGLCAVFAGIIFAYCEFEKWLVRGRQCASHV
ncbi:MAG: cation-translocating P-type ATPase [Rhodobacteraceae bacterium]|nr:cation-translocating P-type ATPase [Paracoccaceae bacterium]